MINLNEEQYHAVCSSLGPVMVAAGPGSGKTRVIIARISYLIDHFNFPRRNILALSYTRAAALQLKERFYEEEPLKCGVTFATIHSIFLRILKSEYHLSDDIIIPPDIKEQLREQFMGSEEAFERKYAEFKQSVQGIDMDDILSLSIKLFMCDQSLLNKYRMIYRYILIDEFQDISEAEYTLLKLLSGPDNNIFAVGDDDQSIYGFRGAAPHMMGRFISDHKEASIFLLNKNYRSGYKIVDCSKRLISHNRIRVEKNLVSANDHPGTVSFRILENKVMILNEIINDLIKKNESCSDSFNAAIIFRNNKMIPIYREYIDRSGINNVSLMTMHGSKGLEFDIVYIPDMNEGICPDARSSGIKYIEEERRLFYVAITRASKELYLYAARSIHHRRSGVSRFIKEMIEE